MSLPGVPGRSATSTFVIGGNAYVAGGDRGVMTDDLWCYNTLSNTWIQKPNFMFANRGYAVAFALCDKGYFGTGSNGSNITCLSDFWRYDPVSDSWTQVTSLPGTGRMGATGFTIGS